MDRRDDLGIQFFSNESKQDDGIFHPDLPETHNNKQQQQLQRLNGGDIGGDVGYGSKFQMFQQQVRTSSPSQVHSQPDQVAMLRKQLHAYEDIMKNINRALSVAEEKLKEDNSVDIPSDLEISELLADRDVTDEGLQKLRELLMKFQQRTYTLLLERSGINKDVMTIKTQVAQVRKELKKKNRLLTSCAMSDGFVGSAGSTHQSSGSEGGSGKKALNSYIHRLRTSLEKAEGENRALRNQIAALNKLKKQLQDVSSGRGGGGSGMSDEEQERLLETRKAKIESMRKEISVLKAQVEDKERQKQELLMIISKYEKKDSAIRDSERSKLGREYEIKLSNAVVTHETKIVTLQKELQTLRARNTELEQEMRRLGCKYDDAVQRVRGYEGACGYLGNGPICGKDIRPTTTAPGLQGLTGEESEMSCIALIASFKNRVKDLELCNSRLRTRLSSEMAKNPMVSPPRASSVLEERRSKEEEGEGGKRSISNLSETEKEHELNDCSLLQSKENKGLKDDEVYGGSGIPDSIANDLGRLKTYAENQKRRAELAETKLVPLEAELRISAAKLDGLSKENQRQEKEIEAKVLEIQKFSSIAENSLKVVQVNNSQTDSLKQKIEDITREMEDAKNCASRLTTISNQYKTLIGRFLESVNNNALSPELLGESYSKVLALKDNQNDSELAADVLPYVVKDLTEKLLLFFSLDENAARSKMGESYRAAVDGGDGDRTPLSSPSKIRRQQNGTDENREMNDTPNSGPNSDSEDGKPLAATAEKPLETIAIGQSPGNYRDNSNTNIGRIHSQGQGQTIAIRNIQTLAALELNKISALRSALSMEAGLNDNQASQSQMGVSCGGIGGTDSTDRSLAIKLDLTQRRGVCSGALDVLEELVRFVTVVSDIDIRHNRTKDKTKDNFRQLYFDSMRRFALSEAKLRQLIRTGLDSELELVDFTRRVDAVDIYNTSTSASSSRNTTMTSTSREPITNLELKLAVIVKQLICVLIKFLGGKMQEYDCIERLIRGCAQTPLVQSISVVAGKASPKRADDAGNCGVLDSAVTALSTRRQDLVGCVKKINEEISGTKYASSVGAESDEGSRLSVGIAPLGVDRGRERRDEDFTKLLRLPGLILEGFYVATGMTVAELEGFDREKGQSRSPSDVGLGAEDVALRKFLPSSVEFDAVKALSDIISEGLSGPKLGRSLTVMGTTMYGSTIGGGSLLMPGGVRDKECKKDLQKIKKKLENIQIDLSRNQK